MSGQDEEVSISEELPQEGTSGGGRRRVQKSVKRPVKKATKPVKKAVKPRRVGGNEPEESSGGAKAKAAGKRKPSAYNLFVKKHMSATMKQNPKKTVADCMKLVAAKWRKEKK